MPALLEPLLTPGAVGRAVQPSLTVEELLVRPWQPSDAAALVTAYRDPAIQRWHVRSVTRAEATELIEATHRTWQAETRADWAVIAGDTVLGRVGLNHLDLYEGVAEFAYWTLPAARGRRVAVRAVSAVSDWAFGLGFHRLVLRHSVHNEPSCRVAGRAGFALEGVTRRDGRHADGWHDMHLHARLAPTSGDAVEV